MDVGVSSGCDGMTMSGLTIVRSSWWAVLQFTVQDRKKILTIFEVGRKSTMGVYENLF